jgi:ABC-type lipoprotein export system ATPase subunit
MSVVLEAREIRKVFTEGRDTVEVLSGASLTLTAGEVASLEGPSGSGKSTFLSILGCLLTPTSGELTIDGETLGPRSDLARMRRERLGFVFQQFHLIPALDALDNVAYPLRLRGATRDASRQKAREMLDAVGLSDRASFLPRDLSGGQKQRVAIARALVARPPVLLADEPTANLDPRAADQVLALFARLVKDLRCALLIVTHDHKVRVIADRVLTMIAGVVEQPQSA